MKQKIISVMSVFPQYLYVIREDERYIYLETGSFCVSSVFLNALIEQDLTFVIDVFDSVNDTLVIAFQK